MKGYKVIMELHLHGYDDAIVGGYFRNEAQALLFIGRHVLPFLNVQHLRGPEFCKFLSVAMWNLNTDKQVLDLTFHIA